MRTVRDTALLKLISDGWEICTEGDFSEGDGYVYTLIEIDADASNRDMSPLSDDEVDAINDIEHGFYFVVQSDDGFIYLGNRIETRGRADEIMEKVRDENRVVKFPKVGNIVMMYGTHWRVEIVEPYDDYTMAITLHSNKLDRRMTHRVPTPIRTEYYA